MATRKTKLEGSCEDCWNRRGNNVTGIEFAITLLSQQVSTLGRVVQFTLHQVSENASSEGQAGCQHKEHI